jgi:hypothetical protein
MVGGYLPKTQVPLIWGIPSNDIHLGLGFRFLVIFIISFLLALWQQLIVNKFIEYGHYMCSFFCILSFECVEIQASNFLPSNHQCSLLAMRPSELTFLSKSFMC